MAESIIALFIPIGICVVMPVLVVWLVSRIAINKENRKSDVLMEAIRNNANVDTDKLMKSMAGRERSARELLNLRLLRGCIFTLLGVAFGVCAGIFAYDVPDSDMKLSLMLLCSVSIAVGVGYLIVYFVSRKSISSNEDSHNQ